MANTFKNAGLEVTTTSTSIYTAPASTVSVVNSMFIANTSNSSDRLVDVIVEDTSAGTEFTVLHRAPIKPGSTLVFDKPVNLEAGDELKFFASADSGVTAFISILEIT